MAGLLLLSFSIYGANRPIGASTYVPYFAGIIFNLDSSEYEYLKHIESAGAWEGIMLLGALVGGFITSVFITKSFRFSIIPTAWKKYKNNSIKSRLIGALSLVSMYDNWSKTCWRLHKWTLTAIE